MKIPNTMKPWAKSVGRSKYGKKILENIQKEERIYGAVETDFWKRLRKIYATKPKATIDEHVAMIHEAVAGTNGSKPLFLKGGAAKHSEKILGKLEPIEGRRFNTSDYRRLGLKDVDEIGLTNALEDDSIPLAEKDLGRPGWFTFSVFSVDLNPGKYKLKETLEIVGLLLQDKTPPHVYWQYELAEQKKTYCPTVLDAGDCQFFEPSPKTADTGTTRPTGLGQQGIREAVHASGTVRIKQRKVIYYKRP